MRIIVCLDDNNGMLFNERRQSRDSVVQKKILELSENAMLRMNHFSVKQFLEEDRYKIVESEDFLEKAEKNDYCFVENLSLSSYLDKIDEIIIYGWNRVYPTDLCFDVDITGKGWILTEEEEFKGTSHECITKKIYIKRI